MKSTKIISRCRLCHFSQEWQLFLVYKKVLDVISKNHKFPNCNTQEVYCYQHNREVPLWHPSTQLLLVTVVITTHDVLMLPEKAYEVVAQLTQCWKSEQGLF